MMSPRKPIRGRRGLTLMEVLVALTVFLLALVVLGRLVIFGSDRARNAQRRIQAADLCQTKLAEVLAGAVSLTSQADVPFEEDPGWHWSLDCASTNCPGLWSVTVRVSRQEPQGAQLYCVLTQMVLDPQIHGNVQDAPPDSGSGSSSSTSPNASSRATRSAGATGPAGGN